MMKTKINILVVLVLVSLSFFVRAEKVVVTVLDEKLEHVKGATVDVWYAGFQGDGSGDKKSSGASDENGKFSGKGKAAMHIEVHVSKDGWYASKSKMLARGQDHSVTVVLRKVENPIPLFVRDVFLKSPVFDEWLGFDFEAGDWVAPQGRGKSRDILFKFHREYMGSDYTEKELATLIPRVKEAKINRGEKWDPEEFKLRTAKWDGVLWVNFPSSLGGIVEEKVGYLAHSEMKLPHLAPEEGYRTGEIEMKDKNYHTKEDERKSLEQMREFYKSGVPEFKPEGSFIRTRVVEVDGKIIKANYAKMQMKEEDKISGEKSPLRVGASGTIGFTYYFNPTPNDRNLEFNAKANLATEQTRAYEP